MGVEQGVLPAPHDDKQWAAPPQSLLITRILQDSSFHYFVCVQFKVTNRILKKRCIQKVIKRLQIMEATAEKKYTKYWPNNVDIYGPSL